MGVSIRETEKAAVERFLSAVESADNNGKWQKSWMGDSGEPTNLVTGAAYRGGFNYFTLALAAMAHGGDNRWAGFGQWRKSGNPVRKDEKGMAIFFPKIKCATCGTAIGKGKACRRGHSIVKASERTFAGWGTSYVFNNQQTMNPEAEVSIADVDPEVGFEAAAGIIDTLSMNLNHGGDRAYYSPSEDRVQMPAPGAFNTLADYWSTMLHETGHWTGHKSRLNRVGIAGEIRTSDTYAYEELVAELTAGFLCMHLNIAREGLFENHVQYIATWRRRLTEDPSLLRTAAGEAGTAMRYILKHGGHDSAK